MALEDRFDEFLKEYREDRAADQRFRGKIENAMEVQILRLNDHGLRLKALERFRYLAGGVVAAIGALAAWPKIHLGK